MNKLLKGVRFTLFPVFLTPIFLFSCSQDSPIDDNDYTVTTQLIGCRILDLQNSYHKNDDVNLSIVSETDYKLPSKSGQLEIQDFDGNLVQCRYDYKSDDKANVSFKMPGSDVVITCSAISIKKYKVNFNFGDHYKFKEEDLSFSPGAAVELHLHPKEFSTGIVVPNKNDCNLPAGFVYRPCEDGLGAVITGTMPNEDISYTYSGKFNPGRTFRISSSNGDSIQSYVPTMVSAQIRYDGTGSWTDLSIGTGSYGYSKIAYFTTPDGSFGPTRYFEVKAKFKYVKSTVSTGELNINPEPWELELPGFPPKSTWQTFAQSYKDSYLTIKCPIIGVETPHLFDLGDFYVKDFSCS